nr:site-specific integrase [Paracoccus saliphilus]
MMNFVPGRVATLADVATWAEKNRGIDDCRALARVERLWENVPLSARKADLAAFDTQFPLHGFDPTLHKSEAAYRAWRRKVMAVIKGYLRQTAPTPVQAAIDAPDDVAWAWRQLLDVIRIYCHHKEGALFSGPRVIPIVGLSKRAIMHRVAPKDLAKHHLAKIGDGLDGNDRKSIKSALHNLNMMRSVPDIAALLPEEEYCLTPWPRRHAIRPLPLALQAQIQAWLDVSCGGHFDPVADAMVGGTSKGDRDKKSVSLRRYCEAALTIDPRQSTTESLAALIVPDIAIGVLRHWIEAKGKKKVKDRTISAYFRGVKTVAAHNGLDMSVFQTLERTTTVLQQGKRADQGMSLKVRKFCEGLMNDRALQGRMMTLHIQARRLAQSLLDRADAENRELSPREAERIRQFGAFAVFCAVEVCGVPLRIQNVMTLRLQGPEANFLMPTKATPFARMLLSGNNVKNRKRIEAALRQDRRNGLDTVLWYVRHVRPLYRYAATSDYLFPAVTSSSALSEKLFREWFKKISRSLGLPMLPHNFRHGLASLLNRAGSAGG